MSRVVSRFRACVGKCIENATLLYRNDTLLPIVFHYETLYTIFSAPFSDTSPDSFPISRFSGSSALRLPMNPGAVGSHCTILLGSAGFVVIPL